MERNNTTDQRTLKNKTKILIKGIYFRLFPNNKGKILINFKIHFDKFVENINDDRSKYLTDSGYLKGCIEQLEETDEFGNTHWTYVNTYEKDETGTKET